MTKRPSACTNKKHDISSLIFDILSMNYLVHIILPFCLSINLLVLYYFFRELVR